MKPTASTRICQDLSYLSTKNPHLTFTIYPIWYMVFCVRVAEPILAYIVAIWQTVDFS